MFSNFFILAMLNVTVTLYDCFLPSLFEVWHMFATFACLSDPSLFCSGLTYEIYSGGCPSM